MTTTIPNFAPTASTFLSAGPTSSNVLIPAIGTPTIMGVANTGEDVVYVAFGSSAVTAVFRSGVAIEPGETAWFTIGTNTYVAAITALRQVGIAIAVGN
ncbi:MAG: hypothetical protein KGL39_56075 [Patescibacteria group bacterium]|nr:hypothetical protein [Patescibacteria group bacterium]